MLAWTKYNWIVYTSIFRRMKLLNFHIAQNGFVDLALLFIDRIEICSLYRCADQHWAQLNAIENEFITHKWMEHAHKYI